MGHDQTDEHRGEIEQETKAGFEKIVSSTNKTSLLSQFLTADVFEKIKDRRTSLGGYLIDQIRSGIANPDSSIGVYATDGAAYETFAPLYMPIIVHYHQLADDFAHPPLTFGDPSKLVDLDPENKYVISTRVRCARSLDGYPLNSLLNEDQYKEIESKAAEVLKSFSGDLQGEYHSLDSIPESQRQELVKQHFLFKQGDRFLEAANACRHWPQGRGIFYNEAKTVLVWVNEEDHLRIISMQKGADLGTIYARWAKTVQEIGSNVPFVRDDRLGYLTFCPTNIGTAIRASVHIKLPNLAKNQDRMKEITDKWGLQVRGTHGEHSDVEGGIVDISNKRRLGLTEFDVVKSLQDGVLELIAAEKQISA